MAGVILDVGFSELNVWRIGLGATDGIEQPFCFFVIAGFILSVLSMSSYPFQGHHWITGSNAVVCVALGLGVMIVFAQMDRDALMSRITGEA